MQRITHSLFGLFASLVLVTASLTFPTLNTPDFAAAEHNVNGFCFEAPISTFAAVPINPTTYTVPAPVVCVSQTTGNILLFSPCCLTHHTTLLQKEQWDLRRKQFNIVAFENVQAHYYIFTLKRIRI